MKTAERHSRIPELDGFRVLLVFIVSWYHIWQQSWLTPRIGKTSLDFLVRSGYLMVDGTVLLSAFLLFLPYARHMLCRKPMPEPRAFYRRRAARILPSYWMFLLLSLAVVVLPWKLYQTPQFAVKDIFTHFTFSFTLFRDTYLSSPVGGVAWTLAIETQMYMLFPWIARRAVKHPVRVLLVLVLSAFAFRGWCIWGMSEYSMVVNQLPAFLDVYALGMAASLLYVHLEKTPRKGYRLAARQILSTAGVCIGVILVVMIMRIQAMSANYAQLQGGQMIRRFPLALAMAMIMLGMPFSIRPLRWLMGNPLMTFLGGISMNYYLLHQTVAVHLKRLHIPYSVNELPNQAGEYAWQLPYTWLCFGVALVLSILMTYGVEKPVGKLMMRWFAAFDKKRAALKRSKQMEQAADVLSEQLKELPGRSLQIETGAELSEFSDALAQKLRNCGTDVQLLSTEGQTILAIRGGSSAEDQESPEVAADEEG